METMQNEKVIRMRKEKKVKPLNTQEIYYKKYAL